jgi:hypothetical protein
MKKTKIRTEPQTRKAKATKKIAAKQTSAGKARAEGLRLFKVAGRPTREQVILVYGERGPVMTWAQRAAAGCARRTGTRAALRIGVATSTHDTLKWRRSSERLFMAFAKRPAVSTDSRIDTVGSLWEFTHPSPSG